MAIAACGAEGLIEGGTISQSTVIDSVVTNSTVASSVIDKATISALSEIDDASIKKIVDGISMLSTEQLATLARVLFSAYAGVPVSAPAATEAQSLPVKVIGGRTEMLGSPTAWVPMGGYVLPLYTKGGA